VTLSPGILEDIGSGFYKPEAAS